MKEIIDLLNSHPFYGGCDAIEIAKGKYQLPTTPKTLWEKIKRRFIKYWM